MTWWPLAWSAELTSRPVAVVRGDSAIVLYRGVGGAALALEDRCPHRRAPLSLGRVTESGMLQCGYHGWTFDGGSGRCVEIPNLRDDEPVPAAIKAHRYPVVERDGVVFVEVGSGAASLPLSLLGRVKFSCSGQTELSVEHESWMRILLRSPGKVIGLPVLDEDDLSCDVDEYAVSIKQVLKNGSGVVSTQVLAASGFALFEIFDSSGRLKLWVSLAGIPLAKGKTLVRWQFGRRGLRSVLDPLLVKRLPARYWPVHVTQELILQSAIPADTNFVRWRDLSQLSCERK